MIIKSQISNLRILVLALVLCSLVTSLACRNSSVDLALDIAASNSAQLAHNAATVYGADDPRTKRVESWAASLGHLKTDFANATTPEEQVKLLPALNAGIDFFDTDILPLLKLSPTSQLIALAVEDALRVAAAHFVKSAQQVAVVPGAGTVFSKSAVNQGINLESETLRLGTYLKTKLRARDNKTGRFVSQTYARDHPDTTVIERVNR